MKKRSSVFLLIALLFCSALISTIYVNADSTRKAKPTNKTSTSDVQFSTSTSQDDFNVYGTATLSENSPSGLSYRVTVTVTSPTGRTNTTQSDWSPAPIVYTTGLSKGAEDGTFTVSATYESQYGDYDEYNNFSGTSGNVFSGNSSNYLIVAPKVSIGGVNPLTKNVTQGANFSFQVSVQSTTGVPNGTIVGVEFIGATNFDNVNYTVDDRSKTVVINNPGSPVNVNFNIQINGASPLGEVKSRARIFSVSPTTVGGEDNQSELITFKVEASSCTLPPGVIEGDEDVYCRRNFGETGYWDPSECKCKTRLPTGSPIIIDVAGDKFDLTDAANGVRFDLDSDGVQEQLAWTSADSDDAWLVLDSNSNNRIDNGQELFGNFTPQADPPAGQEKQGFLALAEYDKPAKGGNNDGKVTRKDAIFKNLRLWQDRNHNGISEIEELFRLPALDIVAIYLDYKQSKRTDAHGNLFKYRAKVRDARNARAGRWAWDVFLTKTP